MEGQINSLQSGLNEVRGTSPPDDLLIFTRRV
jgi:hypothetical protein